MKLNQIQPGYRVTPEVYELVKAYSEHLSKKNGFHVSANNALAVLIQRGYKELHQEIERG